MRYERSADSYHVTSDDGLYLGTVHPADGRWEATGVQGRKLAVAPTREDAAIVLSRAVHAVPRGIALHDDHLGTLTITDRDGRYAGTINVRSAIGRWALDAVVRAATAADAELTGAIARESDAIRQRVFPDIHDES